MVEMSKSEEAAFASMQNEQAAAPEPEAPEAEPSEPEAEVEAEAADDGRPRADERPKFVPHAALHEERTRRQALEAELGKAREERARFDERLKIIQEMNQRREEPAAEEKPDPDDYVGRLEYAERKLQEMQDGTVKQAEQTEAQRQAQARHAHLVSAATEDVEKFKAVAPDYMDARSFYWNQRGPELMALGYSQQEAIQIIERDELSIASQAFQRGKSPAETLYNIAKVRGYTGKAAANGNGAEDGAAEHVERVATGQQRSATLSGTGGGAAPTEMTVTRLLAMSNDEFDAWTTKNPARAARLMGQEPPRRRA